jgi:DNA-binding NtrC family response regulator
MPGAYLFVREGPNSGEIHELGEAPLVVGRDEASGMRLNDAFVSRRHFQVEPREGAYWLVDLGSRNCTVVNGVPTTRRELRQGDEIQVGSTRILFVPASEGGASDTREYEVARAATRSFSAGGAGATEMIGATQEMRRVFALLEQAAPLDVTVLVTGESGTGKELVARALHRMGPRAGGPLVTVNCAAIPRELVDSELFGHEKGAFTGAQARRLGKFELADEGTLFLDEVGELPLEAQAKLLRVLEERKVSRVGSSTETPVDVRIVAATNRDLHAMAARGLFRTDLIYRLEVVVIRVPPLRRRREDLGLLAQHFLNRFREKIGRPPQTLSSGALERLLGHDWPGNVRELKNVVERAAIFAQGQEIAAGDIELSPRSSSSSDLGSAAAAESAMAALQAQRAREARQDPLTETRPAVRRPAAPLNLDATPPGGIVRPELSPPGVASLDEVVRQQIQQALQVTGGNKKRAAELLKISRSTLYNYMQRFGLEG